MGRSTVHYADSETNSILKKLHNKLRPAGTPVQRVEYIIELLLLRIFEVKLHKDKEFTQLRAAFAGDNAGLLFSELATLSNEDILPTLNKKFFPFYAKILAAARAVWTGNLTPKIQDQLVLIEEVFSNSNFSNNVTSGNMAEIIGLVAEIDQDRLLKTDLLGDAIESALSETGGTHDLGLHRTPDHIRQFMVGMIAPTFADALFDPTIGSGGFMFDAFEYVLQGVTRNAGWPGPKAHPELAAWFKDWFAAHPVKMPPQKTATDFYRTGVGGIEYLGMIRKMAAINFYVRGLNPGSLIQGDALEKFGSEALLPESKSAIIANPPFGAERDKDSYPNVWSEYPTETETTILFVKLMLEALKPGGRCAVIVSEGFLTWDQNSARALRRSLLDDCTLQAVISLPQGVFVSKGGQGPKTSILVFTKGGPTRDVWYYKVTNDGYTMGTNRKPQPGCQFVEALDLYHRYVRVGGLPPESRHSFTIPADWIKTLDPRVKDRIRAETRAEMGTRATEDKDRLADKLDAQVAAGKLTKAERKDRLEQHDDLWRSKTENAVAQKIERAHLFSFNLPNYRSSLTPDQLAAWHAYAAGFVNEDDPSKIFEKKYREIAATAPDKLDAILSTLDPRHTLELDIARQFLNDISPELYTKHPHLRTLQSIIASQQKTPRIPLKELLQPVTRPIILEDGRTYRRVTVKLYGKGVLLRDRVTVDDLKGDKWFQVKQGDLIFSKIDARNGAFGLVPEALDDGIVSNEFPTFSIKEGDCSPIVLAALLRCKEFYGQIESKVSGATGRRRFEPDDLLEMEIPLLLPEEQQTIASELERLRKLVICSSEVNANWEPTIPETNDKRTIADFVTESLYGIADKLSDEGLYPVLRMNNLDEKGFWHLDELKYLGYEPAEIRKLRHGDFIFNRTNSVALVGKSAVIDFDFPGTWAGYLVRLRFNESLNPKYLRDVLATRKYRNYFSSVAKPAGGQANLNVEEFLKTEIPYVESDLQAACVAENEKERQLLQHLAIMAKTAQSKIDKILNGFWES